MGKNEFYLYNAEITRVVDGDTVDAIVHLGFHVSANIRFRLTGFDAPETYRPKNKHEKDAGLLATEALEKLLWDPNVVIECKKFGKYRWLGTIYIKGDMEVSVNQQMIDLGHTKDKL